MSNGTARILVFSAHAADFCSRCGGTIIKHVSAGGTVRVVALTYGEQGQSWELWKEESGKSLDEVKTIKRREAETAAGAVDSPWPARRSSGPAHLHLRR